MNANQGAKIRQFELAFGSQHREGGVNQMKGELQRQENET